MTVKILEGDVREVLQTLPDASVHCCVTSPPYYGLRDYGVVGQVGLEPSPEEYVAQLVEVFREVWRVLRPDGVCWLNLGDGYNNFRVSKGPGQAVHGRDDLRGKPAPESGGRGFHGLKEKDLLGIPWRVAFALQDDGWWLRQDNIWAKRNCMPESTTDRTTRAHEYIFQLTKSGDTLYWTHRDLPGVRKRPAPDYRWQHRSTGEEMSVIPDDWDTLEHVRKVWRRVNLWEGHDYYYDAVAIEEEGDIPAGTRAAKGSDVRSVIKEVNGRPPEYFEYTGKRNKRSVWWMATQPFPEAHFATFPPELPEICIKAGTSERGCCSTCGGPWERVVEETGDIRKAYVTVGVGDKAKASRNDGSLFHKVLREDGRGGDLAKTVRTTTGWRPTCSCPAHDPVPCTVLDPFFGAGTAGLVADRLGRNCIGIELSSGYAEMARRRISEDAGLFAEVDLALRPVPVA